jgi:transposase
MEALRCRKRRLSDVIYRHLVADAERAATEGEDASPGGHCGATQQSSAVDLPPRIDTSDQPLPGPAPATLPLPRTPRKTAGVRASTRLLDTGGCQIRLSPVSSESAVGYWILVT